ncbi:hypothetical protein K7G98_27325 [Saccharothrix sp. MB29]|nr:hypothetical protein [Saccharothrix sp. MB29]
MNANVLTDELVIDVPSGNAVFNGVPVTVAPTRSSRPAPARCRQPWPAPVRTGRPATRPARC